MPSQPNVLLLFTDQQRADTISALGNPYLQTPTLDGLVREGVSFTSAYTPSPVCIAARCSMLLGQWAHQTGCAENSPMPQERTSLMELLQGAGYQTHGIGKMHFAPDGQKLWGFDSRDCSEEGGMRPGDDFCDTIRAAGYDHIQDPNGVRSEWYYVPQPSQLPARLHHTQWVGDRSLEFLRRRDRDRPFFLWSSFIKPHPPFESPVPWNRLYKPIEMPFPHTPPGCETLLTYWNRVQNRYKYKDQGLDGNLVRLTKCAYYAAISFVDYQVGRILGALREAGELDNTLVIFTRAHGELLGDFGSWGKRTMLDAAARIPLLVRYPERFAMGERCGEPASLVDVLPTCLGAAGTEPCATASSSRKALSPGPLGMGTEPPPTERPPAEAQSPIAGVDLARLARGEAKRDGVVSQYQEGGLGLYALVTREWKYVYSVPDDREWLFRRAEGQPEVRSLAGNPAYLGTLAQMRGRLQEWFRRDGYEMPLDGDGWRKFPRQDVPEDPDAGQLFQEGGSVDGLFPEGYEPRCERGGGI